MWIRYFEISALKIKVYKNDQFRVYELFEIQMDLNLYIIKFGTLSKN